MAACRRWRSCLSCEVKVGKKEDLEKPPECASTNFRPATELKTGAAGLKRIPGGRGGIGIGIIVVLGLIGWALGIDPRILIGGAEMMSRNGETQQQADARSTASTGAPSDEMGHFVSAVLGSTEAQWTDIFAQAGKTYKPPILVMFSGSTRSGCGAAQSAMGPFYCPLDQKVYLDTTFFQDLERRFRACDVGSKTCQFSQAYVIAHEIGHHVQNQLGLLPQVQEAQRGMDKVEANNLQVRVELQADCLAGVWGKLCAAEVAVHRTRGRGSSVANSFGHW